MAVRLNLSSSMLSPRAAVLAAITIVSGACGGSPTQPAPVDGRDPAAVLRAPICAVAGPEIHCTVELWTRDRGTSDATGTARWSVADSNLSDGLTPSTAAAVQAPGRIVPLRHGFISIRASAAEAEGSIAPHTYEVDPAANAVALVPYVMGEITDSDGGAPIAGVHVEITTGVDAGKKDDTRSNGYYFVEHLHLGVPLTFRASKAGYISVEQTHPPIVDDANGYPEPNFLHFTLARIPQ